MEEKTVETKKKKFYKNPDNYPFNCPCGRNYSVEKNFKAHRRRVHGDGCSVPIKHKDCPLCKYQSTSVPDIIKHFESEHDVTVVEESHVFQTESEFYAWKDGIELTTHSKFSQQSALRPFKSHISLSFKCHRSGYYRASGKGIRRLKGQGSDKMNAFCPASIKVKIERSDGICHVDYVPTHVGHELIAPTSKAHTNKRAKQIIAEMTILGKKDELILRYMEALESITLPEQLEYMEQHFQPVNATLADIREKHNAQFTKKRRRTSSKRTKSSNKSNGEECDISDSNQFFFTAVKLE